MARMAKFHDHTKHSVDGFRLKPDGTDLNWKRRSLLGKLEVRQMPSVVEWKIVHQEMA